MSAGDGGGVSARRWETDHAHDARHLLMWHTATTAGGDGAEMAVGRTRTAHGITTNRNACVGPMDGPRYTESHTTAEVPCSLAGCADGGGTDASEGRDTGRHGTTHGDAVCGGLPMGVVTAHAPQRTGTTKTDSVAAARALSDEGRDNGNEDRQAVAAHARVSATRLRQTHAVRQDKSGATVATCNYRKRTAVKSARNDDASGTCTDATRGQQHVRTKHAATDTPGACAHDIARREARDAVGGARGEEVSTTRGHGTGSTGRRMRTACGCVWDRCGPEHGHTRVHASGPDTGMAYTQRH